MYRDRIRLPSLLNKVMSAADAAALIQDGMTVGMSGFTRAGEAKAVPQALAERAKVSPLKISLMTGASLGNDLDKQLTEAGVLSRRMPFQVDSTLRKAINAGQVMFIDQHLSETVEQLRNNQLKLPDIAVIEAIAITETGAYRAHHVGGQLGQLCDFRQTGNRRNQPGAQPRIWKWLHDIYIPTYRPTRTPIPLVNVDDRIGSTAIPIPPEKIVAIVITNQADSASTVTPPDSDTQGIADHLINFLKQEVDAGRMTNRLGPLQAGIGNIANAVMCGLIDAPFNDLTMYSEVLQDSTFDLFDSGKLIFASGSSITLSAAKHDEVFNKLEHYKPQLVLRPQEISNHPEVIRRLGIIGINTALEFDLYGNVNSTHVCGTRMMNGIGGSGDFARNAHLAIFVTKSIAKGGAISSVVPMVSHVDHTEHDVDILVTEQGLADLRGLAPRERARVIIDNCVHPAYRDALNRYFEAACAIGGHTPHILREALSWHINLEETGHMLKA
ncbi:succinate CoA transferase [Pseudomonas sp. RTB3]|nr:succinate CoA transferase [Pseudomonas sp. RTB3]